MEADDTVESWKRLQLKDKIGKNSGSGKADCLRNILVQVQAIRASNVLDNVSCSDIFLKEADRYAELVDSPTEQGGLDNYAGSVLALLEGKRNESSQWTSSFTEESLQNYKCVQKYNKICKAAKGTLIPPGKENESLPLNSNNTSSESQPSSKLKNNASNANLNPISSSSNSGSYLNSSTNGPKLLPNSSDIKSQRGNDFGRSSNIGLITSGQAPDNQCNQGQPTGIGKEHGLFSSVVKSDNKNPNEGFWNAGSSGAVTVQGASLSESNRAGFGNFRNPKDSGNSNKVSGFYQKPDPPHKRGRENEDQEGEENMYDGPAQGVPMFRTARQQLAIDSQKKYKNRNQPQGQVNTSAYGTNKKSLGTRRGLNAKFVPPALNREDSDGGTLVRKAGPNKGSYSGDNMGEDGEEIDERLKNIDPKMVELIMAEIMDQGRPLTWNDIAGLEFAKKTIQEIVVWPMLRPDIFTGLRGPPKGLLLFGPPGTGKTLIGKCIASQSKSTFFSISASSLTSKWIGDGEKMVRALFAVARVHQPAVVFIDEIDSLLSQRSDTEHESSRRIKTEFLVQLDGATTGEADRILVVGATNRPQEIDEAARRRFVKRLYIPLPEGIARKQIIHNLMTEQSHHLEEPELTTLIDKTQGYSGSDMANLCREAALGPIRSIPLSDIENITAEQVRPIVFRDFEEALRQVRASVSDKDLDLYIDWNKQYGSWGM